MVLQQWVVVHCADHASAPYPQWYRAPFSFILSRRGCSSSDFELSRRSHPLLCVVSESDPASNLGHLDAGSSPNLSYCLGRQEVNLL